MLKVERGNGLEVLFSAEIVTRVQDRISASHTDPPREAKQNPMNYLARNIQIPGLKLCSILGRRLHDRDVIAATSLGATKSVFRKAGLF
jgi:hypothetical protein